MPDNTERDIHVVPNFPGEMAHDCTAKCWCEPELVEYDEETETVVYAHRRKDEAH